MQVVAWHNFLVSNFIHWCLILDFTGSVWLQMLVFDFIPLVTEQLLLNTRVRF